MRTRRARPWWHCVTVVALLVAALGGGEARARRSAAYGMAGCGVGSIIFGDSPSPIVQSLASTFNNFYLTQSFSISSGTSNCNATGRKLAEQQQEDFLSRNLAALAKESARGEGAMLLAFAETFGCSPDAQAVFAATLQGHYSRIFSEPGVPRILAATHASLRQHPEVTGACLYVF